MRAFVVMGVVALALTGCQTVEQASAEHDGYCQSIGAKPGSEMYAHCRLTLRGQLERRNAERARAIGEAFSEAGQQMSQPTSLRCRSDTFAGTTKTVCY